MTQAGFQRNNLDWQLQQWGRQVSEWIQWQFSQVDEAQLPDTTVAPWLLKTLFWLLASAVIAGVLWQMWIWVRPWLAERRLQSGSPLSRSASPSPILASVDAWLRRAQQYQRQGDYAQACRALYMAMLQRLQDMQQLPQQPGLTDGEVLRVVQTFPSPDPYQLLITTHEQVCFSDRPISADTLRRCQHAYQEISRE